MKTRELKERVGCRAIQLARAAGYSDRYWNTALTRNNEISPERVPALIAAIEDQVSALNGVKRDLRREIS